MQGQAASEQRRFQAVVKPRELTEFLGAICSRPTLVNEFTDFDNPYMLKRQAVKRLLEERGTRNALDESLVSVGSGDGQLG